jgi:hypothetical protein
MRTLSPKYTMKFAQLRICPGGIDLKEALAARLLPCENSLGRPAELALVSGERKWPDFGEVCSVLVA